MITRTQRTIVVTAAVAAIVVAANASSSAYFSQSWGWVALAFLVPSTVLLVLDRVTAPGRLRISFAVLVGALTVWIALSTIWSISPSASAREVERVLVYASLALAVALLLRRGDGPAVVGGSLLGVTAISAYGLGTRLFPDRFDSFDDPFNSYRLAEPLGYWNAAGLFATLGVLLALGLVAHARRSLAGLAAAATLPVLVCTLYFTFSRGAWAALIAGLVGAIAFDPRRLRFLWTAVVTSVPSVVCVLYGSRLEALTTEDAPAAVATREGHRMAAVVGVAVVVSVGMAALARAISGRVAMSGRSRRGFDLALVGLGVAVVVFGLIAVGGPHTAWDELEQRFNADPVGTADLNERLFSISGNRRSEQLRVAWNAGHEQPVLGQGAGTFEYLWYERRPTLLVVRDGHSLYMETYAELGLVGLALLGAALLVPLLGAVRARRSRFVAAAAAAYVAWLAGSTFDWHWEMVGLTSTALLAGSVCLLSAERRALGALLTGSRIALMGLTATMSVLAVWSLVGNQSLFAGFEAVDRQDWEEARDEGRRAKSLLAWSFEPDLILGDAAAGLGDRHGALRAYRDAVETDPRNWVAWLRLAQVARGAERLAAYERVRELNPREEDLPGE
jgi:O-Antigen ligase/Tetratricopeptide repeat